MFTKTPRTRWNLYSRKTSERESPGNKPVASESQESLRCNGSSFSFRKPISGIQNPVIRFIYNLLWPVGLLLFLPGYLVKMFRRGGYREKFGQRLGIYDPHLRALLYWKKPIWLHAVSVGEV